jgi:hypothetical protein
MTVADAAAVAVVPVTPMAMTPVRLADETVLCGASLRAGRREGRGRRRRESCCCEQCRCHEGFRNHYNSP